jgi:hypothetical protein
MDIFDDMTVEHLALFHRDLAQIGVMTVFGSYRQG